MRSWSEPRRAGGVGPHPAPPASRLGSPERTDDIAAPTTAEVENELTATRIAIAGYSTPTGQNVTNRNPLTVLDFLERLEARTDRAQYGIVQQDVGFAR